MRPAALLLAVAFGLASGLALADEPSGCAAFKWPLDHERAALLATKSPVQNGGALSYDAAVTLNLVPLADAAMPHPPERAPKSADSFAGHFTLPAPAKPGVYKVTMASEGWIDILDSGQFLHPKSFSGAVNCEGARKSVKFELPSRALDVQLSGVKEPAIAVIVSPAE
jgi:hypothetical protein